MRQPFQDVLAGQFRGRKRAWIVAFLLSSIILILRFWLLRPTCELMFYRADVVRDYAAVWLCLFIFTGLTNRGKLVFGIVIFLWLGTRPMVEYRVPINKARTVRRLREMQTTLKSAEKPMRELTDIVNPALISHGQKFGYVYEYVPQVSERGSSEHYLLKARPFCYCRTGSIVSLWTILARFITPQKIVPQRCMTRFSRESNWLTSPPRYLYPPTGSDSR